VDGVISLGEGMRSGIVGKTLRGSGRAVTYAPAQLACEFANLTNTFPSTLASANDPSLSKSDGTPAGEAKVLAFNSLQKAKVLSPVQLDDAMKKILNQQISLAMKGDVAPKKALDDAASQIDKLLASQ